MIYENIKAPNLPSLIEQLNAYFQKWDPKLYNTKVNDLRHVTRENFWSVNMTREGHLK